MSAPRLISPLLDNFVMGEPIYDRGGIRILPAMEQEKEEKYIVKIISIPANQSQVDALLITGAYNNADAVNSYFAELADGIIREAGILKQLSTSGGFDGYENMQIVPMDDGNGYDVYLLAPYRPTWDRLVQQKNVTQLEGYNLALDLCAALSVARRNGHLYANLRPESISIAPSGSYHICDLGFISLDYLQYSSLPTNYFSPYTAPEVSDAYSSINSTLDVYALGMLLYSLFNGGLPFEGNRAASVEYPLPAYAEEEFGQIILKAIHPDPESRWQDPTEMGQAIVSVMQRKGISDAPIIPVVELPEELPEEAAPGVDDAETAPLSTEDIDSTEEAQVTDETDPMLLVLEEAPLEDEITIDEASAEAVDEGVETATEDSSDTNAEITEEANEQPAEVSNEAGAPVVVDEDAVPIDEPMGIEENPPVEGSLEADLPAGDAEDLDNVLLEADKLIADLQIDENDVLSEEEYEQLMIEDTSEEASESADAENAPSDSLETPEEAAPKKPRKRKALLICTCVLAVLLIIGGLFFYRHVYLQEIDILSVKGTADTVSVSVVSDVDSSKLTVICADSSGNSYEASLDDYNATITGLTPNTTYTVTLKIDGFHKLFGQTEAAYTTAEKTVLSDLTVLNGTEEGSAEVSFAITGPSGGNWTVSFKASGEEEISASALDGKATISGLTSGKTYTVTVSNSGSLYLFGELETTFTSGPVIKAINPSVISCTNGKLVVQWDVTDDNANASWIVRCFNDSGFEQLITVNEPTATINVPDDRKAYSIEIVAEGQSAKEILDIGENSITLFDFNMDTSRPGTITLTWSSNTDIPEEGYLISCVVGDVKMENVLKTNSNSFTMTFAVPNVAHIFTITAANGQSVLCEPVSVTASGKQSFSDFGVKSSNLRFDLCPRPSKTNWKYSDVNSSAYTTTFTAGQRVGVVGRILSRYYTSSDMVTTLYVFKNTEGIVVHTCHTDEKWGNMWSGGYGNFDIPSLPENPGTYTMDMYFNGGLVHHTNITIK